MRRRTSIALFTVVLVVLYWLDSRYVGYTATNLLRTTRVDLTTFGAGDQARFVMSVGDSISLDACIHDGSRGDMYLFVHDCASRHPLLFSWSSDGDGVVRRGRQKLYAEKAGSFTLVVRALGHSDSLAGEILPPVSLTLSTYDTTIRVGDEFVVGSRVVGPNGARAPIEDVRFYDPEGENSRAVRWDDLRWAYPAAVRVRARGVGVGCLGLIGYNKTTWLRVAVVDSAGMTRRYDKPVDPQLVTCSVPQIDRGTPTTTEERAPAPSPALADSDIASGARKAFAYEVCVSRRLRAVWDTPLYRPAEDFRACEDSVAAIAPEWRLVDRNGDGPNSYSATFTHALATNAGERRAIVVDARTGRVDFSESREGDRQVTGTRAWLQGDELAAIRAASSCGKLYQRSHGRVARSLDVLVHFADSVLSATPRGGNAPEGCDYSAMRFAALAPDPSVRVHESGRFTVAYERWTNGALIVTRPVRWGETGAVSYRWEDPDLLRRTFENRAPRTRDEFFDARAARWKQPER